MSRTAAFLIINSLVLLAAVGYAQTLPLGDFELNGSPQLKKNGADKLVVHVDEGGTNNSDAQKAILQGVKNGKVIWQKPLPLKEEMNLPKSGAYVKGSYIELWSQAPFRATTSYQKFFWDGNKATFKGDRVEDTSSDAVEKYEKLAASGTRAQFESAQKKGELEIMYPMNYVHASIAGSMISQGRKAALELYRKGDKQGALDRMKLALDCAGDYMGVMYAGEDITKEPGSAWFNIFASESADMDAASYLPAINDCAFFMQETKRNGEAAALLRQVVKRDPDRVVAYLNLADSLWAIGKNEEAKQFYAQYIERMTSGNELAMVPPRAEERSK
jgi:tetratricopeptide (TPR) repeat protein